MEVKKVLEPMKMSEAVSLIRNGKATYAKEMNNRGVIKTRLDGTIVIEPSGHQIPVECDWQCYTELFTKSDVEPWQILRLRNRKIFLVNDDYVLVNLNETLELYDNYNDSLKHNKNGEYDVIVVYKVPVNTKLNFLQMLKPENLEQKHIINTIIDL